MTASHNPEHTQISAADITVDITTDLESQAHRDSIAIRTEVFVREQHVPVELEVDAEEGLCTYFVAYVHEETSTKGTSLLLPAATLRLLPTSYGLHVQRVAVAKPYRSTGLGREIMLHVIDYARVRGVRELRLDAQTHATGFYESLGFEYADRPEFMDAGIAHREMFLHLK